MAITTVVSLRLDPSEAEKLKQLARRAGRTPSELGADLLGESIRRSDFAFIEFRDSPLAAKPTSKERAWQSGKPSPYFGLTKETLPRQQLIFAGLRLRSTPPLPTPRRFQTRLKRPSKKMIPSTLSGSQGSFQESSASRI